jgi:hypothetical protein
VNNPSNAKEIVSMDTVLPKTSIIQANSADIDHGSVHCWNTREDNGNVLLSVTGLRRVSSGGRSRELASFSRFGYAAEGYEGLRFMVAE